MTRLVVVAFVSLVGCGKDASTTVAKPATESHEFAGLGFSAPKGSTYKVEDETTSEPEQIITGSRYHVVIQKTLIKIQLAGYKETIESEPGASNVTGAPTARGWELTYNSSVTAGADTRKIHIDYVDLSDAEHYECTYDDEDSDVATADAICKSIAKK